MKNLKYNYLVFLLLTLFCSCSNSKNEPRETPKGFLKSNVVVTKAAPSTDDFIVTIYRDINDRVYSAQQSLYPELYELEVGNYHIDALYPSDKAYKKAAFDQPRFWGESSPFTIREDEITNSPSVKCTIQNMQVTVVFDPKIIDEFATYRAKISISEKDFLLFEGESNKVGWFDPQPLTVQFQGTRKMYEEFVEQTFTINTDIAKGVHHEITIGGTAVGSKSRSDDAVRHYLQLMNQ